MAAHAPVVHRRPQEDLSTYFQTILAELSEDLFIDEVVSQISSYEGMLQLFHGKTLSMLRQPIHQFVQQQRLSPSQVKRFHEVIQELYPLSLRNSQTQSDLDERNKKIDDLYRQVQHLNLEKPLGEADAFLRRPSDPSTLEKTQKRLARSSALSRALAQHPPLKQYTDSIENQRLLDLVDASEGQYAHFKNLYLKVVDILDAQKANLQKASKLCEELFREQMQLKTQIADFRRKETGGTSPTLDFVQKILLRFDEYFFQSAYPILWKEVRSHNLDNPLTCQYFPILEQASYSSENQDRFTKILSTLYPDFHIESWIREILVQFPMEYLANLENRLIPAYEQICQLHRRSDLTLQQVQTEETLLIAQMTQACTETLCQIPMYFDQILCGNYRSQKRSIDSSSEGVNPP